MNGNGIKVLFHSWTNHVFFYFHSYWEKKRKCSSMKLSKKNGWNEIKLPFSVDSIWIQWIKWCLFYFENKTKILSTFYILYSWKGYSIFRIWMLSTDMHIMCVCVYVSLSMKRRRPSKLTHTQIYKKRIPKCNAWQWNRKYI